jgi:hypothetical protein
VSAAPTSTALVEALSTTRLVGDGQGRSAAI